MVMPQAIDTAKQSIAKPMDISMMSNVFIGTDRSVCLSKYELTLNIFFYIEVKQKDFKKAWILYLASAKVAIFGFNKLSLQAKLKIHDV